MDIQDFERRLERLEQSDREQSARLDLQRKTIFGMAALMLVGAILGKYSFSDPESRASLERVAIALIASGFAGGVLAPAVTPAKNHD